MHFPFKLTEQKQYNLEQSVSLKTKLASENLGKVYSHV